MRIFHYHVDTGEFVGQGVARPDPLEAGRYLVPRHATTKAPPKSGANEVAVYQSGGWSLVPDHRGAVYWTADGARAEVEGIGETVPVDALDAPPPLDLVAEKEAAIAEAVRIEEEKRLDAIRAQIAPEIEAATNLDQVRAIRDAKRQAVKGGAK